MANHDYPRLLARHMMMMLMMCVIVDVAALKVYLYVCVYARACAREPVHRPICVCEPSVCLPFNLSARTSFLRQSVCIFACLPSIFIHPSLSIHLSMKPIYQSNLSVRESVHPSCHSHCLPPPPPPHFCPPIFHPSKHLHIVCAYFNTPVQTV